MNWAGTAILCAATQGTVSILDSHLASKRIPSFKSFLLLVSVMQLSAGLLFYYLFPLPERVGILPILAGLASGLLRAASISIMFYSLKKKEVTQVIPIIHTNPIFVAVLAVPLLGETLYFWHWLAIAIVVVGAVMVSMEKTPAGVTRWPVGTFVLLSISSLFYALANITAKYALNYISFWNSYSLGALGIAFVFLVASLRPHVIDEITSMPQRGSSLALFVFKEAVVLVGMLLLLWSIEMGPVSLVSTIVGSRPIFVVIYSMLLGWAFPNFLIKSAS